MKLNEDLKEIETKEYPYTPLQFTADMGLNLIQYGIVDHLTSYKINDNNIDDLKEIIKYCETAVRTGIESPKAKFTSNDWMNTAKFIDQFNDKSIAEIIVNSVAGRWSFVMFNVNELVNKISINNENEV